MNSTITSFDLLRFEQTMSDEELWKVMETFSKRDQTANWTVEDYHRVGRLVTKYSLTTQHRLICDYAAVMFDIDREAIRSLLRDMRCLNNNCHCRSILLDNPTVAEVKARFIRREYPPGYIQRLLRVNELFDLIIPDDVLAGIAYECRFCCHKRCHVWDETLRKMVIRN